MSARAMIAGAGRLPVELVAALDTPPLVCAPEGAETALPVDVPFRFERLVPFLRDLGARGVTQVVFAGAIHRPRLDPSLFDPETAALVPRLLPALQGGDDALLRAIIEVFNEFDLDVQGAGGLAPVLLAPQGTLTARAPTRDETADATRATGILSALDVADVAQAVIVARGLCLGVEAIYGTDALLAQVATARPSREPRSGGVLAKRAKAGQDLRMDLPTVGPATIAGMQAAGLTGLCLQAGRVIMLERARMIAEADAAGITIWANP
jgi:DUF1009 family protein